MDSRNILNTVLTIFDYHVPISKNFTTKILNKKLLASNLGNSWMPSGKKLSCVLFKCLLLLFQKSFKSIDSENVKRGPF